MKNTIDIQSAAEVNKKTGQPFFILSGFRKSHAPWFAPQRMYDLYNVQCDQQDDDDLFSVCQNVMVFNSFAAKFSKLLQIWIRLSKVVKLYQKVVYNDLHTKYSQNQSNETQNIDTGIIKCAWSSERSVIEYTK